MEIRGRALQPIAVLLVASCLTIFIAMAGRGIDLTDTAFYISWATYPEQHRFALTWFGQITGILLDLAKGNIKVLSLFAAGFVFALGCILSAYIIRFVGQPNVTTSVWRAHAIAIATGGCGFLAFYSVWILVPSYNWLALISAIMVSIGLLDFMMRRTEAAKITFFWPAVMVASGLWLSIFAKFTTTLGLGILGLIFLAVVRPSWRRTLSLAVPATVLMALFTTLFHLFVRPLDELIADTILLNSIYVQGGSTLSVFDSLRSNIGQVFRSFDPRYFLPAALAGWFAPSLFKWLTAPERKIRLTPQIAATLIVLCVLFAVYRENLFGAPASKTTLRMFVGFIGFSWVAWFSMQRAGILSEELAPFKSRIIGCALLLFGAAFAMQFGSQNDLRFMFNLCLGFLICIAALPWLPVVTASPANTHPLNVVLLVFLLGNFVAWAATPYRLNAPAWQHTTSIDAPLFKGMTTTPDMANALNGFREAGRKAGLTPADSLIDMTGASPFAHLLFETKPLSAPWLLGGPEPRRELLVDLVLEQLTDDQKKCAWVLHSTSARAFSPEQLKRWNISLNQRKIVAQFEKHPENAPLYLYKPIDCRD